LLEDLGTQLAFGEVSQVAAAFVFDANSHGVPAREAGFAADHASLLNGVAGPSHGQWVQGTCGSQRMPVGLFVFHDPTSKQGTLEHTLGLMVSREWPQKWHAAGDYLSAHQQADDPVTHTSAESLKAQICITGQFRFPGDPMTEVLKHRGLPPQHFQGPVSQALVAFLSGVPW
jgi:hypothetical protein